MDEAYRLPFPSRQTDVVVDLGANIGLTNLFYHWTLHPRSIIAVEPDPSNAQLVRENLAGLPAVVLQAAVGSHDGTARFAQNRASNLGTFSSHPSGIEVLVMSMDSVLKSVPEGANILVKLDIEGGEEELLRGDTGWLSRVDGLIVEFHPDRVDYPGLIRVLQAALTTFRPGLVGLVRWTRFNVPGM
ncbi:MAG: FkbM family methyltransferase [Dermatophilaceae bacterium]